MISCPRGSKVDPPFPINDAWLANHATESGDHLVTFNTPFSNIPGILLWQK
jgi:predicted nucleic acid-binding protein